MKRRFAGALTIGLLGATLLVVFEDKYRHAALAASAARPLAHGGHLTLAFILATGFVGVTLIVTGLVFAVDTVLAYRQGRRGGAHGQHDPGRSQGGRADMRP